MSNPFELTDNFDEFTFGEVVTVRPVPSRAVTQIVIEVPEEFHIQVTQKLFRKNAFIFAAAETANIPYGVRKIGEEPPEPSATPNRSIRPGLDFACMKQHDDFEHAHEAWVRVIESIVWEGNWIVKWLALRCKEGDFQRFMDCTSEVETVNKVRDLCEVQSRADIPMSEATIRLFMDRIYSPFKRSAIRRFG